MRFVYVWYIEIGKCGMYCVNVGRVNPGDAVGSESWSSRYISDSVRKNALKCRPIPSLEAKQLNE